MARARKVVSDQNSQEFDELRRQFNNLLLILERFAREEAATTTSSVEAAEGLASALEAGVDGSVSPHVGTGREVNGVHPTPTHPRRPRKLDTEDMGNSSDY
jgi:hypothetical protein